MHATAGPLSVIQPIEYPDFVSEKLNQVCLYGRSRSYPDSSEAVMVSTHTKLARLSPFRTPHAGATGDTGTARDDGDGDDVSGNGARPQPTQRVADWLRRADM